MTFNGLLQIVILFGLTILLVKPVGWYLTRVFTGERTFLSPVIAPVERGLYRLAGMHEKEEQHWTVYAASLLMFSIAGFVLLYFLQRLQGVLPYNPAGMQAVGPESA